MLITCLFVDNFNSVSRFLATLATLFALTEIAICSTPLALLSCFLYGCRRKAVPTHLWNLFCSVPTPLSVQWECKGVFRFRYRFRYRPFVFVLPTISPSSAIDRVLIRYGSGIDWRAVEPCSDRTPIEHRSNTNRTPIEQ